MTTTLEQAAFEFKESIDKFVEAYKAKHAADPEGYPLELSEDNSGLWIEFIVEYHVNGSI